MTLVDAARLDIGKKEKPGNLGFQDPKHEKELLAVGWQPGWAWCAGQVEAWVWKAFPQKKEAVKGLFVPSAVNTFRNLVKAGYKSSMIPTVGAIVFWQKMDEGKALWQGHTGVVCEVLDDTNFKSIEGNTSNNGSRNGDGVYMLSRKVKPDVQNGLKVIGFVTI
jgi:CHAP domain-containing protein